MSAFKCPKCGVSTSGRDKFCNECGQPLDIVCPDCGNKWRFMFDHRFCENCGCQIKKKPSVSMRK